MKNNTLIFVLLSKDKKNKVIKYLEMKREDSLILLEELKSNIHKLVENKIEFAIDYKPEIDESFVIDNYELDADIKEIIANPIGVETLSINESELNRIKAVFIVEKLENGKYEIIFQKFQKSQILKNRFINLFFTPDNLVIEKNPGITITNSVDCYFLENKLYFKKYYIANQILDLTRFYREATDKDLDIFFNYYEIPVEDTQKFKYNIKKWMRHKIAIIVDNKILEKYDLEYIKNRAAIFGIDIELKENRIIFPKESKKQKEIIKFLLDEIYRGSLTDEIYETNSKKVNK
ncbi:hypothetical protein STFE110948_05925 [Streptobacillus felis]|uniref:hypothetical protein n=1 Tax=Streptobacillus felis TaxID=1384509 RepID=UPI00082BD208|nr:hypothetical protein [Streptobacillus felis]